MVEGKWTEVVFGTAGGDGGEFPGIFALTAEMKGKEARLPIVLKGASTPFQFKLAEKPKNRRQQVRRSSPRMFR
jgi:hypothetical protein